MAIDGWNYLKLAGYHFLIRSDMDVFLTPLFDRWLPRNYNDFYVVKRILFSYISPSQRWMILGFSISNKNVFSKHGMQTLSKVFCLRQAGKFFVYIFSKNVYSKILLFW